MIKTSIIGFPHIGENRELKFTVEKYFSGSLDAAAMINELDTLKIEHWNIVHGAGIDFIPSHDFFYYDMILELSVMLNIIQDRYLLSNLDPLDIYFTMARGHQEKNIKALDMKKWFTTNYHYFVPEIDKGTTIRLANTHVTDEYLGARQHGITTKPVITGPFTFFHLAKKGNDTDSNLIRNSLITAYSEILKQLDAAQCEWVQFDEPYIVKDLTPDEKKLFISMYSELLNAKGACKILLQTYFGDIRDIYREILSLPFDAVGLDFIEGIYNSTLLEKFGFPEDRLLFAGVVSGRNIWVNDYRESLDTLHSLSAIVPKNNLVINTSCSLLHVPFSARNETVLAPIYKNHLSFAVEKLKEVKEIALLFGAGWHEDNEMYIINQSTINRKRSDSQFNCEDVRATVKKLGDNDFNRNGNFRDRSALQKQILNLPLLPTTTIGSFPQTAEVRKIRNSFKKGDIDEAEYNAAIREKIMDVIKLQEDIGLDVLVHGEFERNDMVEYFGENLTGFIQTENGWVQSYGTRCVKPPVIFGDVKRKGPITVDWISFAQGLTEKPVKGMLTGPVTILNWSFPREDITPGETAFQIALAIRDEVEDLERAGIKIIQIDEAALREKLPVRKSDWKKQYLDWAIPSFRLTFSRVKPETQIQTHMCYSEFSDIMDSIKEMDADVILIEAAKSDLSILESLQQSRYENHVGPGLYDIHSPRIPGTPEMAALLGKMKEIIPPERLWVNPDCGLKTRQFTETIPSLKNMVAAAHTVRKSISG